jgi:hypothetical protein
VFQLKSGVRSKCFPEDDREVGIGEQVLKAKGRRYNMVVRGV